MKTVEQAFTLAEVLITLTIIGVIASMTIPGLINNINDLQYKAAWKKTYADFSSVSMLLAKDQGGTLSGSFGTDASDEDPFRDPFIPYLNVIKTCDNNVASGNCWHKPNEWYKLSNSPYTVDWNKYSRLVLTNGTLLTFKLDSLVCARSTSPKNDSCGYVYFDINGFKPPNKISKDIFGVQVLNNGIVIPIGVTNDNADLNPSINSCDLDGYPSTEGWSCSSAYLYK